MVNEGQPDSALFEAEDEAPEEPVAGRDIPPNRELITTPYDPSVQSLYDQIQAHTLIVNPDFQRGDVWDPKRKSRLIESLLLNIPIPPIFLAEDEDGTRVVVDGQQRLRAIHQFVGGSLALTGLEVLTALNGKHWIDLTPRQSRIIANRPIRAIVISPQSDPNIRFEVFERLNTGVVRLTDQELRNSIYRGDFNRLLDELAHHALWLTILNRAAPDVRLRHHELILRYFALRDVLSDYNPPLKDRLNDFMRKTRSLSPDEAKQLRDDFINATVRVAAVFDTWSFRKLPVVHPEEADETYRLPPVSRAIYDIEMISLREFSIETLDAKKDSIRETLVRLSMDDDRFQEVTTRSTDHRRRLYDRLRIWGHALQAIDLEPSYLAQLPAD